MISLSVHSWYSYCLLHIVICPSIVSKNCETLRGGNTLLTIIHVYNIFPSIICFQWYFSFKIQRSKISLFTVLFMIVCIFSGFGQIYLFIVFFVFLCRSQCFLWFLLFWGNACVGWCFQKIYMLVHLNGYNFVCYIKM